MSDPTLPIMTFDCAACAEPLRGVAGMIAACPACGRLQDAPEPTKDERAAD